MVLPDPSSSSLAAAPSPHGLTVHGWPLLGAMIQGCSVGRALASPLVSTLHTGPAHVFLKCVLPSQVVMSSQFPVPPGITVRLVRE